MLLVPGVRQHLKKHLAGIPSGQYGYLEEGTVNAFYMLDYVRRVARRIAFRV
jgi:hypothetical protein